MRPLKLNIYPLCGKDVHVFLPDQGSVFEKPETNRKFDNLFKETDKTSVMNTVEYLKMEGREEARIESATTFVQNLLKGSDFTAEKIASLANVSVEFVNKVKSQLNETR